MRKGTRNNGHAGSFEPLTHALLARLSATEYCRVIDLCDPVERNAAYAAMRTLVRAGYATRRVASNKAVYYRATDKGHAGGVDLAAFAAVPWLGTVLKSEPPLAAGTVYRLLGMSQQP